MQSDMAVPVTIGFNSGGNDASYQKESTDSAQTIAANTWTTIKSLTLTKGVWIVNGGGMLTGSTATAKYFRLAGNIFEITITRLNNLALSAIVNVIGDSQTVSLDAYSSSESSNLSVGAFISAAKIG